jgi:hypothetical protein
MTVGYWPRPVMRESPRVALLAAVNANCYRCVLLVASIAIHWLVLRAYLRARRRTLDWFARDGAAPFQSDAKEQYTKNHCDEPTLALKEQCRRWKEQWDADVRIRAAGRQTVSENVTREFAKTANEFVLTLKSSTVVVLIALLSIVSFSFTLA